MATQLDEQLIGSVARPEVPSRLSTTDLLVSGMSRVWLIVAVMLGCQASKPESPPALTTSTVPPAPSALATTPAQTGRRVVGKLHENLKRHPLWPSRMCVDGDDLVVEIDCCCHERVVCHVDRAQNATVDLSLTIDTTTMACLSATPMIPGRCAIPTAPPDLAGNSWTIAINGQVALELPLDRSHKAHDGDCWTGNR